MNQQQNLLDLSDEILLMILKELPMVDVLYSLADANRRLNRLAHDSLYIRHLDLTGLTTISSRWNQHFPTDQHVVSRTCEQILPRIHDQVHQLTVEPYAMKDILAAVDYPQLYSLSLRNFQDEVLHHCLTDDLILRDLLRNQITHLHLALTREKDNAETVTNAFTLALSLCERLTELEFTDTLPGQRWRKSHVFLLGKNFHSSTLTKLKINVAIIYDCLLLLDGRLDSLSTLIINVADICDAPMDILQKRKLPRLKCFSLISFGFADGYDTLIVPLLRRMINLEELKLYLTVYRPNRSYIDGAHLSDQVLNHLPQLEKFTFNIQTRVSSDESNLPLLTNEAIQRSFSGRDYQRVASFVHTDGDTNSGDCQIFSLPYDFEYFLDLDHSFQGGLFRKVRFLTMRDKHPFEDALFRVISQDMPFLESLEISNEHPQKDKQRSSTVLIFPHLKHLDLRYAHDDYVELFLLKTSTCLLRLSMLRIEEKSLRRLTNDFNSDSTQFNIHGLKSLDVSVSCTHSVNWANHFRVRTCLNEIK